LNKLKTKNKDYREVIPRLEECMQAINVALDTLQKDWNQLKVQYRKESKERKRLEETLDKVDRNLESIKGQLVHIEIAKLGLYKQIQGLEQEFREVTGKKEELQMEVEELQADPPLNSANLEALVEGMRMLTHKVERANFY
jgi:chromosome segregation ATPase